MFDRPRMHVNKYINELIVCIVRPVDFGKPIKTKSYYKHEEKGLVIAKSDAG